MAVRAALLEADEAASPLREARFERAQVTGVAFEFQVTALEAEIQAFVPEAASSVETRPTERTISDQGGPGTEVFEMTRPTVAQRRDWVGPVEPVAVLDLFFDLSMARGAGSCEVVATGTMA